LLSNNPFKIVDQSNPIPIHFVQLRAIHLSSFPPSERGDFDEWLAEISAGNKWLYIATIDDALVGYATILPNVAPQVYFLEYLAVAREHRNAGIGGQLLRHLARELRGKANGLIWEVETPDVGTPDERQLRARRIAFYSRNGGMPIDCAPRFRAPNLAGGEPVEEKLMWLSLAENSAPPRGEALRECIVGILTRDYGLLENDALVQENLHALRC